MSLAALSALMLQAYAEVNPLVIKDKLWFDKSTGEQFYFKGIAYAPKLEDPDPKNPDPLANPEGCERDLKVFKDLGLNAIRVYEVQLGRDHEKCMKLFEDNGIYVIADLNTPKYSINRESPQYDTQLYSYHVQKAAELAKYPNLAAFVVGNEVTNEPGNTNASMYVKTLIRDVKDYLKKAEVSIPVGYATNDDAAIRHQLQDYFACGEENERVDFYGVNLYQWCGSKTDFVSSGYSAVVKNLTDYPAPVILTEYGCNINRPRTFDEVGSLYGSDMDEVFSGGFMYAYSEDEKNDYGLVNVKGNDVEIIDQTEYDTFKEMLGKVKPSGEKLDSYSGKGSIPECPKVDDIWHSSEKLLSTPSDAKCSCVLDTLPCLVGASPKGDNDTSFSKAVGEALDFACGEGACDDISADAEKGEFGEYATCNMTVKAAVAMSTYYKAQKNNKDACDFDGLFKVASPSRSDDSECKSMTDPTPGKISTDGKSSSGDANAAAQQFLPWALQLTIGGFATAALYLVM
ncbi:1 3-beta-glucanosyltransferase gel4 [Dispira parvispora]|uniref:1,3-beta-glucanosyltransferase n=1 Tax=Dispira parvispora TaxID=1520584 RepID=A0A9W8E4T4_9FUNG|nr:1 3-beta-glucanosyltransferase gel4 [Dispira parvispora]